VNTPEKPADETAEALFARISRRRRGAERTGTAPVAAPVAAPVEVPVETQIDVLADAPHAVAPAETNLAAAAAADPAGSSDRDFPRSATLRLLLRHPELALGIGLPAAGLLLGYPKSRRLLGAALRLGARPEVQQAIQLTSVLRQRGRRRAPSDSGSG